MQRFHPRSLMLALAVVAWLSLGSVSPPVQAPTLTAPAIAVAAPLHPVWRIMFGPGDSLSVGYQNGTIPLPGATSCVVLPTSCIAQQSGARLPLYWMLYDAGYSFDFVGSRVAGPYPLLPDRDHEGREGWSTATWLPVVSQVTADANPDVAIMMLGTNDCQPDPTVVLTADCLGAAPRLGQILDYMLAVRPTLRIIVSTIPPVTNGDQYANTRIGIFNAALPAVVAARSSARLIQPAWQASYVTDGVHLGPEGYGYWATVIDSALVTILGPP